MLRVFIMGVQIDLKQAKGIPVKVHKAALPAGARHGELRRGNMPASGSSIKVRDLHGVAAEGLRGMGIAWAILRRGGAKTTAGALTRYHFCFHPRTYVNKFTTRRDGNKNGPARGH